MVRGEEPFKSFQIYRPVIENRALLKFLTSARVIGESILDSTDMVTLSDEQLSHQVDDEMMSEMGSVALRSFGIARHRIYDSEKIKLTLFDRRSPVSGSTPLTRLYQRFTPQLSVARSSRSKRSPQVSQQQVRVDDWRRDMRQAALRHDIPNPEELAVKFDCLTIIPNPGYERKGWEFSLLPDTATPEGLLLVEEAVASHNVVSEMNQSVAYPTSRPHIEAAFARLPLDTQDHKIADFHARISKLLPVYLTLGDVKADI